ncbi:hypothetical protein [Synechocystis sp. PCC 7509]|nr:hypothetical protein [Synechocystis sp. PCC 7509]
MSTNIEKLFSPSSIATPGLEMQGIGICSGLSSRLLNNHTTIKF